ncbi:MAG: sensor histidine kinase [Rhodospirillaceae bacterium]
MLSMLTLQDPSLLLALSTSLTIGVVGFITVSLATVWEERKPLIFWGLSSVFLGLGYYLAALIEFGSLDLLPIVPKLILFCSAVLLTTGLLHLQDRPYSQSFLLYGIALAVLLFLSYAFNQDLSSLNFVVFSIIALTYPAYMFLRMGGYFRFCAAPLIMRIVAVTFLPALQDMDSGELIYILSNVIFVLEGIALIGAVAIKQQNKLVSAKQELEEAVHSADEAQRIVNKFFDQPMNIHVVAGLNGEILKLNEGWRTVLGHDPEDVVGDNFMKYVHPDDVEPTIAEVSKLSDGQTTFYFENRYKHMDGGYRLLAWSAISALEEQKIYAVASDITDRKDFEAALISSKADLERSNADLQKFAYIASHDLREPLRMVTNFLQLLVRRYGDRLDSDGLDFVDYAVTGAKRMDVLIKDLLEYARFETDAEPFKPVKAETALNNALDNLQPLIDGADAKITIGSLPMVVGDASQLMLLFQNLLSNAIKYRAEDRDLEIQITAQVSDGTATFSVQDNGIGISPEFYERIFVIFQRLHGRDAYSGTGIGLAVCKKIVERHGGAIWVESTPERGSSFHFSLSTPSTRTEEAA